VGRRGKWDSGSKGAAQAAGRSSRGAGPEGRGVSQIVSAGAAAVGRRAPALQRGPISGPIARENAIESRLSVGARERHPLVKGCERKRGWVRLCLGAREKLWLVNDCEDKREGRYFG
jgi:hypothetical protein